MKKTTLLLIISGIICLILGVAGILCFVFWPEIVEIHYGEFIFDSGTPKFYRIYDAFSSNFYIQIDVNKVKRMLGSVSLTKTTVSRADKWEAMEIPLSEDETVLFGFSFVDDRCLLYRYSDQSYLEVSGFEKLYKYLCSTVRTDRYYMHYIDFTGSGGSSVPVIDEYGNLLYQLGENMRKRFFYTDTPLYNPSVVWFLHEEEPTDPSDIFNLYSAAAKIAHYASPYEARIFHDPYSGQYVVRVFPLLNEEWTEEQRAAWIYGDEVIITFDTNGLPLYIQAQYDPNYKYVIPPDYNGYSKRFKYTTR